MFHSIVHILAGRRPCDLTIPSAVFRNGSLLDNVFSLQKGRTDTRDKNDNGYQTVAEVLL